MFGGLGGTEREGRGTSKREKEKEKMEGIDGRWGKAKVRRKRERLQEGGGG